MPGIRCVFLDLGRTLVGLDLGAVVARMNALAAVTPVELERAVMYDGLASSFETGTISEQHFHELVCARLGKVIPPADFFAAWNAIFLPDPILPEGLVARIAERAALWALSNTNSAHYRFLKQRYTFFRYFSGKILSFEVGLQKPDERIFKRALDLAGVGSAEALFVDDHLPNVEAARKLGIDAFQFLSRDQFVHEMRARQLLSNDE